MVANKGFKLSNYNSSLTMRSLNCLITIIFAATGPCTATGYHTLNGECVYISETEKSWFEAKSDCLSRNGDLVKVGSEEKHDQIKDNIVQTGSKHWIGLISHRWRWVDG